ncbi:MAG: calcium-binding protein, partial [Rhodopseudomonas sp.]|uniref:calcium-binding protein n=1 Tax=Rhodopseudomonas sp. TaxID=1078 RepID=UPI0039E5CB85
TTWVTSGYTGQQWVSSGYTGQQWVESGYYTPWLEWIETSHYENVWVDTSHYEGVWVDTSHYESSTVEVRADGGSDVLSFGSGVTAADLTIGTSGNDLIVAIKDPANPNATFAQLTDRITLQNWTDPLNRIESFKFVDGTTLDVRSIASFQNGSAQEDSMVGTSSNEWIAGDAGNDIIIGAAGNDILIGGVGNDILNGGVGNDTLVGGGGSDVYVINRGDGQDHIKNGIATNMGVSGELDFGPNISIDQLWFQKSNSDLVVSVLGTDDRVIVDQWYSSDMSQLNQIKLSDGSLLDSGISQLVQAMAIYSAENVAFNVAAASQVPPDPALQGAIAAAWHH